MLALLAACARPPPVPPHPIDGIKTAISKGDYLAAYELMPSKFRKVYSTADFVRMMAGERITPPPPPSKPAPEVFANTTPREAVRSFVLAWQRRRWDVMMGLVPTRYREHLSADKIREQIEQPEQRAMLQALVDDLDNLIDEDGDQARMSYGGRYEVRLVREDDGWKIDDLD